MKHLVRVFLFNVFALWFTSQILPGLIITGGWQTILFGGFILCLLMLIVAPILRILFIPINILTFGLLAWLVNVMVIYLLTLFVPEMQVVEWNFAGASWAGFVIPSMQISYILSLILVSLGITVITDILHYVSEE
jgi:putative membrane protein